MQALRNSPVLAPPSKSQRVGPGSPYLGANENVDMSSEVVGVASGLGGVVPPGLGEDVKVPGSHGPLDLSPDKSQDAKSSGGVTGKDVGASAGSLPAVPSLPGFQVHAGDVSSGQAGTAGHGIHDTQAPYASTLGGQTGPQASQATYVHQAEPTLSQLFQEIRAGNQNVDSKFQLLQGQVASFQTELASMKAEMVTQIQFGELQTRVSKLESSPTGGPDIKALTLQLDRLDPAKKSLAMHGITDVNLDTRTSNLEKIFADISGCPRPVNIEHVFKGKAGERSVTKVSLLEFRSNAEREKAFALVKGLNLQDNSGAKLACKRARTNLQRQRNDGLIAAEGNLKKQFGEPGEVKIDWEHRQVKCKGEPAFIQDRVGLTGSYVGKFATLVG